MADRKILQIIPAAGWRYDWKDETEMADRKILQIIPAAGWRYDWKDEQGQVWRDDLACFALVDEGGDVFVVGLSGSDDIDFADLEEGFERYVGPDGVKWVLVR